MLNYIVVQYRFRSFTYSAAPKLRSSQHGIRYYQIFYVTL